ncbi:chloroplast stem-loop binding of 41 kDa chloroplastic-like [Brachionus plicatilis]|uniref:Chloroplast stem-loop binding of 41 kDa chloroplastic-like n=1 Tax=Brachionus plicatilis TaxID=10195 RepID=A0A3M7QCT3_BRAPC|nr:chloroplast stem-loop binding of 41 kDa chloroplastic-like [Brachionus plicatilis]
MSKNILILGGNGFIGAECVEYLLDNNQNYNLVLVNRDNWNDWDTMSRIKSRIKENIKLDRKKGSLKAALWHYLSQEDFKFDAVIDFSAYKVRVVKNFFQEVPKDKFKIYILISSDSVYEVCQIDMDRPNLTLDESDSIRPESESERKKLKELDSYGHHKLKCEEELLNHKVPYLILRLPDVIGPRDSTNRFWFYQMYLEFLEYKNPGGIHEIKISKFYHNKKTSYVFVRDVARVIDLLLKTNKQNEIVNLGFEQAMSINDLLALIALFIKPGMDQRIKCVSVENCANYIYEPFPSVTKAPFSDLNNSFEECVRFYQSAYSKFESERRQIEKELKKEWIKDINDQEIFKKFINQFLK